MPGNDLGATERAEAVKSGLGKQKAAAKMLNREVDAAVDKVAKIF